MQIPDTQIAVTLYNLREYCKSAAGLDETLAKVKDIGYRAVQISGIGAIEPGEVKELLEKHQLFVCATHEGLANLREKYDEIVAKMKLWECDFTALGSPGGDYYNAEGVAKLPGELEEIAIKFKQQGMRFGYHNHHRELEKFNSNKTMLDTIYDETEILAAEIDVHWIARGGGSPVAWIKKVAGRMPVVHFKDFAIVNGEPVFCEIGEGNLDWKEIIKACEDAGVRWYSIEQDKPFKDRCIFESIKISYENLRRMGVR